jgi:hypothetical protein
MKCLKSRIKYIISNVVWLKKTELFLRIKSESYFIVDELNANSRIINLTNVPAANYTKVALGGSR